jgi:hypothetical protein
MKNNIFFKVDKYYIYINSNNEDNKYVVELINNDLYIFINNINRNQKNIVNMTIKIMHDNLYIYIRKSVENNMILIENIDKLNYEDSNKKNLYNMNNNIYNVTINNSNFELNFYKEYPNFDFSYYVENNKFINCIGINSDEGDNNSVYGPVLIEQFDEKYLMYHWLYFGQKNKILYLKYLFKKYNDIITTLKYPKITYNISKKNTLLFIDDRYDSSFLYLLILFLYSVDETWNINIFTISEKKAYYENDFKKLGINGKIHIIEKKFNSIEDYNRLLISSAFWKNIIEDNILLFQYDSIAFNKFNPIFFDYNYIGARWPYSISNMNNIYIGNGGTSFRKARVMEYISKKYENSVIKKIYNEDIFFAEMLAKEDLYNCTNNIADMFSFENIFVENSVYAHQIFIKIDIDKMDNFVYQKLIKLEKNQE